MARLQHKVLCTSNIIWQALKAGIPWPCLLSPDQCLDGIEVCSRKLKGLQTHAHGLRKVHLRNCLVQAQDNGDKERYKGILRTIERKEQKLIWRQINRATNNPRLGAIPLVQQMEGTEVVDIVETKEMNAEIQQVMEQRFDLSMSASITMLSLQEKLGFLSDTELATNLLSGDIEIPDDIDDVTAMILREIIHLFQALHSEHQEITLGEEQFQYYWGKFKEKMSSSITKVHAGHNILATYSDVITTFLSRKIALIARGGCPPDRWGHGLQVMLEKVAGDALVNKLHAILLMEGDFNYMKKWIFGHEAINKLYDPGYVPGDQYSQKESTAEDAWMDNRLTMDISHQLRQPLATMAADADKCYNRINHIIMSFFLLAMVGTMGPIVVMLHPIQAMKFYQCTARGDSNTFMGGQGKDNPLQGLCQGNGAAPACWLMISSLLMHCYQFQGYGSPFISPISGTIINFLGEIYVDNADLIVTRPNLTTAAVVHEELERSASAWAAGLNATGRALNPEKCKWTLADYCCKGGKWKYAVQPDLAIEIPLPNGDLAKISLGEVLVAEKALGIWFSIDGNNEAHVEHNVIERVEEWINRMRNGHLPAKLGSIAYPFKL